MCVMTDSAIRAAKSVAMGYVSHSSSVAVVGSSAKIWCRKTKLVGEE